MNEVIEVFRKYAVFSGRASLREYWHYNLIMILVAVILLLSAELFGVVFGVFVDLFFLFLVIPSISVGVRRLHDIGKSGWWMLVNFVPLIGGVWFFIYGIGLHER